MDDIEHPISSRSGGSPEDIARELREFSKSAEIVSSDRQRLVDEYALQWIGVYRGEVTANAEDLPTLMEELERRGVPPSQTVIRFIEKEQRMLIV